VFRLQLFLFVRNLVLLGCACQLVRVGAGSLSLDAIMEAGAAVEADGLT